MSKMNTSFCSEKSNAITYLEKQTTSTHFEKVFEVNQFLRTRNMSVVHQFEKEHTNKHTNTHFCLTNKEQK
jgi:hypothetical protein